MENPRRLRHPLAHGQPVLEVVAHVVAAEGKHGHGVAADLAELAELGGSPLRGHRRRNEHAVLPIEGLVDQRGQRSPPAAKNDGRDRHAVVMLDAERVRRTLIQGRGEAAVRVGADDRLALRVLRPRRPRPAQPIPTFGGRFAFAPLPPDRAVLAQHDVGVDRVAADGLHHAGVGLCVRSRGDAEKAGLGIDGPEPPVRVDSHPGDVVADSPDAVALLSQPFRRDKHGEVGLSAGAGKGGGDVLDAAFRILHAHDEHVLGQPSLLLAEVTGDAEREAFLAQEDVSAVARADAPDRVVLGEMEDQPPLDVEIGFAVQAFGELAAGPQLLEHGVADVRHDPHVQHHVDAVGQLDADLAEGRADGSHREGDDVHRPAAHGAVENFASPPVTLGRRHPIIGRPGVLPQRGADVRQVLGPGDVVCGRAVIETAGELFLIQHDHLAGGRRFPRQTILLLLRAVNPNDLLRLAKPCRLLDPFLKFAVLIHVFS